MDCHDFFAPAVGDEHLALLLQGDDKIIPLRAHTRFFWISTTRIVSQLPRLYNIIEKTPLADNAAGVNLLSRLDGSEW